MKINYDIISDAIYFVLKKGKVKKTIKMKDQLLVDVDAKGNIIGIEMLNASTQSNLANFRKISKKGIPFNIIANTAVVA